MDNKAASTYLLEGAQRLGLPLEQATVDKLLQLQQELLRWNRKVNLTSLTSSEEVLEKHFLDSLAVLPALGSCQSLLDVGAGAGFPGLVLKIARPALELTLVDAVEKKVGFLKHAIAHLRLYPGARALHAHLEGKPEAEKVPKAEALVARALMELGPWLKLAAPYTLAGGRVLALLGQAPQQQHADELGREAGLRLLSLDRYTLPYSGAQRALAVYARP